MNQSTGKSPSELLLGYQTRQKAETKLLNETGEPKVRQDRVKMRKRAAVNIVENRMEDRRRYDLRRASLKVFRAGDAVGVERVAGTNEGQ